MVLYCSTMLNWNYGVYRTYAKLNSIYIATTFAINSCLTNHSERCHR